MERNPPALFGLCPLQIEIASICFGISDFLQKGSLGIGLGIAIILYFLKVNYMNTAGSSVLD